VLTNGGDGGHDLSELELVENGGLTGGIESDHENSCKSEQGGHAQQGNRGNGAVSIGCQAGVDLQMDDEAIDGGGCYACGGCHLRETCFVAQIDVIMRFAPLSKLHFVTCTKLHR